MKKLAVILILALILIMLSACGNRTEITNDMKASSFTVVNPMMSSSLEDICEKDGVIIALPDTAKDAAVFRINVDPILDSISFTDEESGIEYNFRIAETESLKDISGMYYEWGEPEGGVPGEDAAKCFTTEDGPGLVTWYRDGHSFSLSVSEGAVADAMIEMYKTLDGLCSFDTAK